MEEKIEGNGPLGGTNRAKILTPERRSEIARNAAKAMWAKKRAEEKPRPTKKRKKSKEKLYTIEQIAEIVGEYDNGLSGQELTKKYNITFHKLFFWKQLIDHKKKLEEFPDKPLSSYSDRTRRYTPEQIYKILIEKKNGASAAELALKYQVSLGTIFKWRKEAGYYSQFGEKFIGDFKVESAEQRNAIIVDYKNGLSTMALMEKYGYSRNTILRYIKKEGELIVSKGEITKRRLQYEEQQLKEHQELPATSEEKQQPVSANVSHDFMEQLQYLEARVEKTREYEAIVAKNEELNDVLRMISRLIKSIGML